MLYTHEDRDLLVAIGNYLVSHIPNTIHDGPLAQEMEGEKANIANALFNSLSDLMDIQEKNVESPGSN